VISTNKTVEQNCALLGHYAASSGSFLSTFRDALSVPPSGVSSLKSLEENFSRKIWTRFNCLRRVTSGRIRRKGKPNIALSKR
jgi:hypothetical protein